MSRPVESKTDPVAEAIWRTLESPNEADRNMEAANVVDGLFAIARSLSRIAVEMKRRNDAELGGQK
jgi:hypothetical protein